MKIHYSNWRALPVLLTIQLLAITDIFIVNVALPSIRQDISANDAEIQLIVTAYMIGFASFMITGSKLGDQIGRKQIFLTGIILFMLASIGCAMSPIPEVLISFRFLQGVGAALMVPQVLTYIQILFTDNKERTRAIGWYGVVIGAGTLLGQLLGGYFSSLHVTFTQSPWRLIFVINIPVCIAAVIAGQILLPESKNPDKKKNDYKGLVMMSVGLLLLVYAISTGNDSKWSSSVWMIIISSVILLSAFARLQFLNTRSGKSSLINTNLFRYRNFILALTAISLLMIMIDSYFFILTIFLQSGYHLSPLRSGYVIIVQGAGFMLTSSLAPRLFLKFGTRSLIFGLSIIIISMTLQATCYSASTTALTQYSFMIVHGAGVALVLPPLANIALSDLPEHLAGNASGVYATLQQIFGAIGVAICGNIFFGTLNDHADFDNYYSAFEYGIAFNILCLLGVMVVLLIHNTKEPKTLDHKKINS